MTDWLPALPGHNNPCLNCPDIETFADMESVICVGFGSATLVRDGEVLYDGEQAIRRGEEPWTFAHAEALALEGPERDWRIALHGPMHGETYQWQGPGRWVLIEANEGFA